MHNMHQAKWSRAKVDATTNPVKNKFRGTQKPLFSFSQLNRYLALCDFSCEGLYRALVLSIRPTDHERETRQAKHQGQVQGRRQVKVKNKLRNQRNRQGHHPAQSKAHSRWKKVPKCRFYERDGNCKHGDNCQYFHDFTKFKEAQSTNLNKKSKRSKNRNANVRNGMNGKGNAGAARRRDQKRRRRN